MITIRLYFTLQLFFLYHRIRKKHVDLFDSSIRNENEHKNELKGREVLVFVFSGSEMVVVH